MLCYMIILEASIVIRISFRNRNLTSFASFTFDFYSKCIFFELQLYARHLARCWGIVSKIWTPFRTYSHLSFLYRSLRKPVLRRKQGYHGFEGIEES